MNRRRFLLTTAGALAAASAGCNSGSNRVVLYCAQDREFAEQILADFTARTSLPVASRFDTEANKSVGLVEDLVREADKPRCDVHWNNEILATIRLAKAGILEPYDSPSAQAFPASCRDKEQRWTAFAARARRELARTGEKVQHRVAEVRDGAVREFELSPEDAGVSRASIESLRGGDAAEPPPRLPPVPSRAGNRTRGPTRRSTGCSTRFPRTASKA